MDTGQGAGGSWKGHADSGSVKAEVVRVEKEGSGHTGRQKEEEGGVGGSSMQELQWSLVSHEVCCPSNTMMLKGWRLPRLKTLDDMLLR